MVDKFLYFRNHFWEPFSHAQTLVKAAKLGVGQNRRWEEVELCETDCSNHRNDYKVFLNLSFPSGRVLTKSFRSKLWHRGQCQLRFI